MSISKVRQKRAQFRPQCYYLPHTLYFVKGTNNRIMTTLTDLKIRKTGTSKEE